VTSKQRNKILVEICRLKKKVPQTKADSPERRELQKEIHVLEAMLEPV
jgi:hypothetical protein